jgi:hypothetical protein
VVISHRHRLAYGRHGESQAEYATDDFEGAPLWRLRFGTGTRLYYLNIPTAHEIDPRSSRLPLKVHAVLRREGEGWAMVRPVPTGDGDPTRDAESARGGNE